MCVCVCVCERERERERRREREGGDGGWKGKIPEKGENKREKEKRGLKWRKAYILREGLLKL